MYKFYTKILCWPQRRIPKILLIMKLTTVLLFALMMQVSATTLAQKVTLKQNHITLKQVFKEIRKQTGYDVLYHPDQVNTSQTIDANFKDTPVEQVIDKVLEGQPLTYTIDEKTIVIKKKEEEKPNSNTKGAIMPIAPSGRDFHCDVRDKNDVPLVGASIINKKTKKGTLTNAKGEFVFPNVLPTDTLLVSYVGYKTYTLTFGPHDDPPQTIRLEETNNALDQVVVKAYGVTTQREATANIATVTAAEIERQPVMNPLMALQGKVAGLDVTQTNGYASAPVKVELRGRSSINLGFTSDPLYIIDGVPLTVLDVSGSASYYAGSPGFLQSNINGPANGQSPLFNLDPANIETITVLKDAAATAIYGSRGANGVILITTKKGKPGATQVNVNVQQGYSKQTRFYQLMNTEQYIQMRREAYKNDGLLPSLNNNAYDLLSWSQTSYTDWQKEIYGGTGHFTDAQVSLFGGSSGTTFRIAGSYRNSTAITQISGSNPAGNFSLNLGHASSDNKFKIALTANYSSTKTTAIGFNSSAILLPPNAPPILDAQGNPNYDGYGGQNSSARGAYPFSNLFNPFENTTNLLNASLNLNYQIAKGLSFGTTFGYNLAHADVTSKNTIASQDPLNSPTGYLLLGKNRNENLIIEPQIHYDALIGKGKLQALLGGSVQQTSTDGLFIYGYGYTDDRLLGDISSATNTVDQDHYGQYKYAALFASLNYSWEGKYIIDLSGRRDGSSRFGPGKQYGNFGSVGAAWLFTEESWFKNNFHFLSSGKLRGSYGLTGTDAVGDYQYLTRWQSTQVAGGGTILAPIQHADPNFQWESTKKLEGALDLGFLQDRVTLEAAYYRNRVGNQLISFSTPALSGFTSVTANSPAQVQNSGWELLLNAMPVKTKDFSWGLNFNMAINKNILLAYPNIAQSPYANSLVVGQSLNVVQLFHYTGVDPQTGLYTYQDKNHDGFISGNPGAADDRFFYNLSPKFLGGFGTNLTYKNLQLSMFFTFKKQLGRNALSAISVPFGQIVQNIPSAVLGQEWKNPGDKATIAKFSAIYPNDPAGTYGDFQNSDGVVTDASYIRLSNLSLSYNLPDKSAKKFGAKTCSVFIHTNDLFIITSYKGTDPETGNFGSLPPARTITAGLSVGF